MMNGDNAAAVPSAISGFWRRLAAFILDILLLGLIGAGLGLFLFDKLAAMGGWGRIIGFGIAVAYFGVMNSRLGGGHSLGKVLMKIKVVAGDGLPLAAPRSFARATILCVPYFLNGAPIDLGLQQQPWLYVILSVLILGVGGVIAYLVIFNRKTRQSLHDLAVGSYVVRASADIAPSTIGRPWRGHYAVVAVLLIAVAVLPVFTGKLTQKEPFASLLAVQKRVAAEPGVRYATVNAGQSVSTMTGEGTQSSSYLSLHVIVKSRDINQGRLADRIAQIVLDNYADAANKDVIAISMAYGYDIGIASGWRAQHFSFSPAQWQERVKSESSAIL